MQADVHLPHWSDPSKKGLVSCDCRDIWLTDAHTILWISVSSFVKLLDQTLFSTFSHNILIFSIFYFED